MKWNTRLLVSASLLFLLAGCGAETLSSDQQTNGRDETLMIAEDIEYGKEDYKKIVEANNQLGMELLAQVPADEEENTFISPTSLYMALSMLYNGVNGETKTEIADVLNTSLTPGEMSRANASLSMMLANNSESIELDIANSVWLNREYDFKQLFIQKSKDYFNANVDQIDVADPETSDRINSWVKDSTEGMIEKMVSKPLDSNIVAILLNAIYFNGEWTTPFEEKNTEQQPFYLGNGKSVDLPLMKKSFDWMYFENEHFQAAVLPYGDREANMFIFLPKAHSSLEKFEEMLTIETWKEWRQQFENRYGTVALPKFELEYKVLLNEPLKALGMRTSFTNPDLSNMLEQNGVTISEVLQKTAIKVDEKGTEAAAVTKIEVAVEGSVEQPFDMIINRPFFLMIEDAETGIILFMGAISNPLP